MSGGWGSGGFPGGHAGTSGRHTTGGTAAVQGGDDCETEVDEEGLCQLMRGCEMATLSVWCNDPGDGAWGCSCIAGAYSASYEIADESGIAACRTAARVCSELPMAEFGESVCTEQGKSSGEGYCSEQIACESRARIGPGVDAVHREYRFVYCKSGGTEMGELFDCGCSAEVRRAYRLRGFDPSEGCGLIRSVCDDEAQLGDVRCEPESVESGEDYCLRSEVCSRVATVGGREFELFVDGEVSCRAEGGRVLCRCSGPNVMQFDYLAEGVTADSCDYASEVCWRGPVAWEDGQHTCSFTVQSADETSCQGLLDCVTPARFEDDELRVHGPVSIECRIDAASASAACTCLGAGSEWIEVDGADGWDACTRAAEACPDLVGPDFAPVSGF